MPSKLATVSAVVLLGLLSLRPLQKATAHLISMEGESISVELGPNGLCPITTGGGHHRCLPLGMGRNVAEHSLLRGSGLLKTVRSMSMSWSYGPCT